MMWYLFVASFLVPAETDGSQNTKPTPRELIAKLSSPDITVAEMERIEELLSRLKPKDVIPALLPKIAQGMPNEFGIWNGAGSAKGDAIAPPEWRAFYSYHRIWKKVAPQDRKLTSRLLADRFVSTKSPREHSALIQELRAYWHPDVEDKMAAIMHKVEDVRSPWRQAAECLLERFGDKYCNDIKEIIKKLPSDDWRQSLTKGYTISMLLNQRSSIFRNSRPGSDKRKLAPPFDPELLRIAFETVQKMESQEIGMGYLLAMHIGEYVGQNFEPDRKDPGYREENSGFKKQYYIDGVQTALDWWQENKDEFKEREAEDSRP